MVKSIEISAEFLKPSLFDALKQELTQLETVEPGSKSMAEAIAELLPLIKGCRDRGHSWNRICLSFQKYVPDITVGMLRKYAFEFDPSLKGTGKASNESVREQSLIPTLESQDLDEGVEDAQEDEEDEVWPPIEDVNMTTTKAGK
jgi:hypothetical protein